MLRPKPVAIPLMLWTSCLPFSRSINTVNKKSQFFAPKPRPAPLDPAFITTGLHLYGFGFPTTPFSFMKRPSQSNGVLSCQIFCTTSHHSCPYSYLVSCSRCAIPNISNSSWFQPQTIFSPKRPSLTCETVTICLAAKMGCTNGACTVPNTVIRLVLASSPQAQVIVSSVLPSKSVSPPYPFHRAIGSKNSMPASSAICASFRLFSQEAFQRSRTFATAIAPEQFGEKIPSLSLFPLNIVVRGLSLAPGMIFPRWSFTVP